MKFIPQKTQILARRVDIVRTKGGLELPDSTMKGVTKFALIEAVGPDVKNPALTPGQLVLAHHFNFIYLRDGFTRVLFVEDEVMVVVEGLPKDQIAIEGEALGNGQNAVLGAPV